MKHADFKIGGEFWCSGKQYRCTDIGARVVVAIRIDWVNVYKEGISRTFYRDEAEVEGLFNGSPYAVTEHIFDEHDQRSCSFDNQ